MKKSIALLAFFLIAGFVMPSMAQGTSSSTTKKDNKEYKVQVFFHCENGKALLEQELPKKRGVVSASADLATKIVTVVYDSKVTDPAHIVEYIHQIGYLTADSPAGTEINKACSHGENSTN